MLSALVSQSASSQLRKVLLVSDTGPSDCNGTAEIFASTSVGLRDRGIDVKVIEPNPYRRGPNPLFPSVPCALVGRKAIEQEIRGYAPDAVHIFTEGSLGRTAKKVCESLGLRFTTSFLTTWSYYLQDSCGFSAESIWLALRNFHNGAARIAAPCDSFVHELTQRGFKNVVKCTGGVSLTRFQPRPKTCSNTRPIFLCVSRAAPQKNIPAFLDLELPGEKWFVGGGPMLAELQAQYGRRRDLKLWGEQRGNALERLYSEADVFVLPSVSETFGEVIVEALASGIPVAGYPVPGPREIIVNGRTGCLNEDLHHAALAALKLAERPETTVVCREAAKAYDWETVVGHFVDSVLVKVG